MKKIIASVVVIAVLVLPMTAFAGGRMPVVENHQAYVHIDSK
ncbi:hypothetical protein [Numidum massiliense]|nr:hypothetical protein [Numidum massiliense]